MTQAEELLAKAMQTYPHLHRECEEDELLLGAAAIKEIPGSSAKSQLLFAALVSARDLEKTEGVILRDLSLEELIDLFVEKFPNLIWE